MPSSSAIADWNLPYLIAIAIVAGAVGGVLAAIALRTWWRSRPSQVVDVDTNFAR